MKRIRGIYPTIICGLLIALLIACDDGDNGGGATDAATADVAVDQAVVDAVTTDGPPIDGSFGDAGTPDASTDDLSGTVADGAPTDQKAADASAPDVSSSCKHPKVVKSCTGGWCTVPAGCFLMGSPAAEKCRFISETQHEVSLTHSFEISATEVSRAQFQAAMGYDLSLDTSCGASCPVENVSWHEAAAYCNALSKQKKLAACYVCSGAKQSLSCAPASAYSGAKMYGCPGYRLPHEAEWEYAYRAGTATAFYNGAITSCTSSDPNADLIGWYAANSGKAVHPAAQKVANGWGLHDMGGNVWEWCQDWNQGFMIATPVTNPPGPATGTQRTLRGGGFSSPPANLRAADRGNVSSKPRADDIGFRCVRSL